MSEELKEEMKEDPNNGLFIKLSIFLVLIGIIVLISSRYIETQLSLVNIGLWIITISLMLFLFLKNKAS